jgi:hypothetical protein
MKQKINQGRNPPHKKVSELRLAVQQAWDEITLNKIVSVIQSMPFRIHDFMEANGGPARW